MTKIVYNACFGGFSISREAVLRGREISGDDSWGDILKGERYSDGELCDFNCDGYGRYLSRTDPILVQVVEEMGRDASSRHADLQIRELDSGTRYRIDEYDGNESVMTIDDYEWETA